MGEEMSTTKRSGNSRIASGQSRSHGQSRARQTGSRTGASSGRQSGARTSKRTSTASRSGYSSSHRKSARRRRKNSPNYTVIAIIGIILMVVITSIVYGLKGGQPGESESKAAAVMETELKKDVTVDGITITGMSRDAAKAEILKNYPWGMKVRYGDDVYDVENLMAGKVDALLDEIYTGKPRESYTLDTDGLEPAVKEQVAVMKNRWNKAARNGSISSYDAASDSFVFAGEEAGIAIEDAKLTSDIMAAIKAKDFDAEITASASALQPDITVAEAKEMYKTIVKYTTKTTANKKRNTNVRLAAETLNGAIVGPGQELSFNETVGERTAEKGYQGAAAYNNGEVVEEIGGGVCQVSTTLYNAVVRAGMEISFRRSHTFEPSYVTPGMDATVSWGGPDFKFINTSSAAIGIRAKYADQTMTVSIYGIPVLEEGVTYDLESTKIAELEPPEPTYVEDQTLQLDEEVVDDAGTKGSRWQVKLVVKKNGEIISQDVDHTTNYKGHAPVIKRNTSGVVIPAESVDPLTGSVVDPSAAMPSESIPSQSVPSDTTAAEIGPGAEASPIMGETAAAEIGGAGTTPGGAAASETAPMEPNHPAENQPSGTGMEEWMPGDVSPVGDGRPASISTQIVAPKPEG